MHKYKLLSINFTAKWIKEESTPTVPRITVHKERSKEELERRRKDRDIDRNRRKKYDEKTFSG